MKTNYLPERIEITKLKDIFSTMDWWFSPQILDHFGVDATIELMVDKKLIGRKIAIHLEADPSYFSKADEPQIAVQIKDAHRRYWSDLYLPIIIVLYNREHKTACWGQYTKQDQHGNDEGQVVIINKDCMLDASAHTPLFQIQERYHKEMLKEEMNVQRWGYAKLLEEGADCLEEATLKLEGITRSTNKLLNTLKQIDSALPRFKDDSKIKRLAHTLDVAEKVYTLNIREPMPKLFKLYIKTFHYYRLGIELIDCMDVDAGILKGAVKEIVNASIEFKYRNIAAESMLKYPEKLVHVTAFKVPLTKIWEVDKLLIPTLTSINCQLLMILDTIPKEIFSTVPVIEKGTE